MFTVNENFDFLVQNIIQKKKRKSKNLNKLKKKKEEKYLPFLFFVWAKYSRINFHRKTAKNNSTIITLPSEHRVSMCVSWGWTSTFNELAALANYETSEVAGKAT